jgi:hypothetical protein
MNRRRQWTLAALALALAAGTARAQTGASSSSSSTVSDSGTAPAAAWEFTTTRQDGEARLQVQSGPGATATCESITLRMAGTPVTLTTDGQKVRVRIASGDRGGVRMDASADRVRRGGPDVLTLEGQVQARSDRKGQCAQIIKAERVTFELGTGSIHVEGAGSLGNAAPAPVSLDFGFPVLVPAAEKEKEQTFNFWLGHSR